MTALWLWPAASLVFALGWITHALLTRNANAGLRYDNDVLVRENQQLHGLLNMRVPDNAPSPN